MREREQMRRYHHKIFFAPNVGKMTQEFIDNLGAKEIGYTNHAEAERFSDRRDVIPRATHDILFDPSNTLVEFYEILTEDGQPTAQIQKLVIRVHFLDDNYDYTYVIAREGYVVSNWSADKNDNHRVVKSFDRYFCPPTMARSIRKKVLQDAEFFEARREPNYARVA